MRRLTLAVGAAVMLAGSAVAQSSKIETSKPITDYKAVQEQLYELNYRVGERNGQLSPQLQAAIAQWRKNRSSTATGDMTEAEAKQLLAAPRAKAWGAIAYAASGPVASTFGKPSRDAAEKDVSAACEKANAKCTIVAAAGCSAVATFAGQIDGKTSAGAWGSYNPKIDAAKTAALADCKKNALIPDTCVVRDAVCADGSHKK